MQRQCGHASEINTKSFQFDCMKASKLFCLWKVSCKKAYLIWAVWAITQHLEQVIHATVSKHNFF